MFSEEHFHNQRFFLKKKLNANRSTASFLERLPAPYDLSVGESSHPESSETASTTPGGVITSLRQCALQHPKEKKRQTLVKIRKRPDMSEAFLFKQRVCEPQHMQSSSCGAHIVRRRDRKRRLEHSCTLLTLAHEFEVRSAFGGAVISSKREHWTTTNQILIELSPIVRISLRLFSFLWRSSPKKYLKSVVTHRFKKKHIAKI